MSLFTLEDKLSALEILKREEYAYDKAAKKIGISVGELREWAKELMPVHLAEDTGIMKVVDSTEDQLDTRYTRKVKEAKVILLQKIRDLGEKEKDLDKVTRALKLLHDITKEGPWQEGGKGMNKQFFKQVNNAIFNIKKSKEE